MTARITSEQRRHYNQFVGNTGRKALREVDPDRDGLQRLLARGDEFQAYYIAGIRRFTGVQLDYDLARSILGQDFISPKEIAKARNVTYSDEQLAQAAATLPSQEVPQWFRDHNFFLIAGPPSEKSLLEVRELKSERFYSPTGGWYANRQSNGN